MAISIMEPEQNTIWVNSENDPIGTEIVFELSPHKDSDMRYLIALASYLGYEPEDVLKIH